MAFIGVWSEGERSSGGRWDEGRCRLRRMLFAARSETARGCSMIGRVLPFGLVVDACALKDLSVWTELGSKRRRPDSDDSSIAVGRVASPLQHVGLEMRSSSSCSLKMEMSSAGTMSWKPM